VEKEEAQRRAAETAKKEADAKFRERARRQKKRLEAYYAGTFAWCVSWSVRSPRRLGFSTPMLPPSHSTVNSLPPPHTHRAQAEGTGGGRQRQRGRWQRVGGGGAARGGGGRGG
jgi:uncharacterized membrane protein YgcG